MQTKDQISMDEYDLPYSMLDEDEQYDVDERFDNQTATNDLDSGLGAKCGVARIDDNGIKYSLVSEGTTVAKLIEQTEMPFDKRKEGVSRRSNGNPVSLTDIVIPNEIYVIGAEVDSAC